MGGGALLCSYEGPPFSPLSLSWMKSKSGRAIFHLYPMMTRVNVCGDGEAVLKLAALAGHTGCKENGGHGSVRLGTEN